MYSFIVSSRHIQNIKDTLSNTYLHQALYLTIAANVHFLWPYVMYNRYLLLIFIDNFEKKCRLQLCHFHI